VTIAYSLARWHWIFRSSIASFEARTYICKVNAAENTIGEASDPMCERRGFAHARNATICDILKDIIIIK
jgi:hypothetical protein